MHPDTKIMRTTCCIAGGTAAGMMLGMLLARTGVSVIVLEKHGDFLRDFRGDTIHPSTLELLHELGILEEFLRLPHQRMQRMTVMINDAEIVALDLSHLSTRCKYTVLMPQWDFLNFLAVQAKRYATSQLLMNTEAIGTIEKSGRVVGV
jgi:2-polyprenyl-6-methoxyphenol hydroxylase-like FAD-dependent oxidoreductase